MADDDNRKPFKHPLLFEKKPNHQQEQQLPSSSCFPNFTRIRPRISTRSRPISALPILTTSNSVLLSPSPSIPTCMALSENDDEYSQPNTCSSTTIPIFVASSTSSHWTSMTWGDIKRECSDLINSVELTMNDTLLTAQVYTDLQDKKRALQTAMRRRNRVPDEVWLCFKTLQRTYEDVLNGNHCQRGEQRRAQSAVSVFGTPRSSVQAVNLSNGARSHHDVGVGAQAVAVAPVPVPSRPRASLVSFNGDVPATLEGGDSSSCLDILSSTLIRCGIELELYDEETQGLNRIAGVGLGIAVFVAICTVVYYF